MFLHLAETLGWCVAMSLVTLVYGEYAGVRQAKGRPIKVKERLRNLLIVYAVAVGLTAFPLILNGLWGGFAVVVRDLEVIGKFALTPLVLWYLFDLPLRLARQWSQIQRPEMNESHALDGTWPQAPSFLDRITESRSQSQKVQTHQKSLSDGYSPKGGGTSDRHRSPALDRVAKLQPGQPSPPKTS